MKDEAIGILEWIAYHRALGVERFYLYDNGSSDGTTALLAPLVRAGIVDLTSWPQRPGQLQAYDDFAARHGRYWRWAAFIDADEFINPFGYDGIGAWLRGQERHAAVAIQWLNFGPDGHDDPPPLAIEAYRHRLPDDFPVNGHVKTIVRMDRYARARSPHSVHLTRGSVVDEHGRPLGADGGDYAVQPPIPHEAVCINHYYTRSRAEFVIKTNRGLADQPAGVNIRELGWLRFYEDQATVRDDRIRRFAPRTKAMLAELQRLPGSR